MSLTRRHFLQVSTALAGSSLVSPYLALGEGASVPGAVEGFGPLVSDPGRILDLPKGFSYRAFSKAGETMSDGLLVPYSHDGMAAFQGPKGSTILVRNHEMKSTGTGAFGEGNSLLSKISKGKLYDPGDGKLLPLGGTTTLTYDTKSSSLLDHHLSLAGTGRNCAGGATPWGSWITCEEWPVKPGDKDSEGLGRDHGWCFEVPSRAEGLVQARPLKAMGRFNHEAAAVDPRTGIVYLSEDDWEGLFYRFIPKRRGDLARGGKLQALALRDKPSAKTGNFHWMEAKDRLPLRTPLPVRWVDLENVEAPADPLKKQGVSKGAAEFCRGEGLAATPEGIYLMCTQGGLKERGQVFLYRPSAAEGSPGEEKEAASIEIFAEPNKESLLDKGDNICQAPFGDLIVCEDGDGDNFLVGLTSSGASYKLARAVDRNEFAGSCFSPDGGTLFVNLQYSALTLAITGPWNSRKA